jgi:Flp pilus assembly protein TadB
VVDPFLFAVARLIVNAKVANGKNIEETFTKIAERFNINERETFAIQQLLRDMGYPWAIS